MHLVVENIRSDDALQRSRAETYLLENPDPGVRLRPSDQLERAIETGQGLIVSEGTQIRGLSLVYQYDPGDPDLVDYEIGTMRITANGLGLQAFLGWLHLVQIVLEDDATRGNIFAVVTPDSDSAHNMVTHVGMSPWEPSDTLKLLRRAAGVDFDDNKLVLTATDRAIGAAFQKLNELHLRDNQFRARKGSALITVAMGWFGAELLDRSP
ncbi:MAG: hypothetical protein WBR13_01820 [Allosphingosinicella sp.]